MAVDPLIAKALTHLAVKVATDEETRKKMLLLILTPVLSVLLIMSMFFYILTHPLDFLGQFFDSQTLSSVEQLQSDFGMYQGIPQTDSDYTDSYKAVEYYKQKQEFERDIYNFSRLSEKNFGDIGKREIKSSGYVVDTLEAAIWCLLNTKSYKESVLMAVNLGEDTDTVAAVTGGLAGLYYGYENIPKLI